MVTNTTRSLIRRASAFLMLASFVLLVTKMAGFGKSEIFLLFLGSLTLITAISCLFEAVTNRSNHSKTPMDVGDFTPTGAFLFFLFAVLTFAELAGIPLLRQFER